nr:MAG TPA: E2 glycoprotein [Caudoviricetes sp.]
MWKYLAKYFMIQKRITLNSLNNKFGIISTKVLKRKRQSSI